MNTLQIQPTAEIETPIVSLEETSKSVVITNADERNAAIETLQSVKSRRQQIVEFFADSKSKAHAAWKSIVASEKSFTDRLDAVESSIKKAVLGFDAEAERLRRAEQQRLQAEADALAKKERERLEREAAKLKTPELKERRLATAAAVVAPVVQLAPASFSTQDASTRKTWKARVINTALVPREFMMVNESALAAFAKSTKGTTAVAGVEFYEESNLAIRR